MALLINADDLKEKIVWERDLVDTDNMHGVGMHNGLSLAHAIVLTAPTVDAVPVVHGRWIEHKWAEEENGLLISNFECSACHNWERKESDYCPNCGAKMDLEE